MTDSGLTDLDALADQQGLPRDKEASQDLQQPETKDETNENEDGTTAEENNDTKLTILVNGETIQISEDFTGTHIQNKDEGHGLHVQKNGDIIILSGSGGKGQSCGGRMLINTKNGQITKSGPITEEVNASSNSEVEKGSVTSEDSGRSQVAYSGSFSGDHEIEIQGTKYVKARDIVLDATDTLTLKANQIIVAADEWVEDTGLKQTVVDTELEEVTSQRTSEVKEDTSKQYDTRASKNVVGTGSISHKIQGDLSVLVAGLMDLQVQGGMPKGIPLIKNRTAGLNIGINGPKSAGSLQIKVKDLVKIHSTGSSFEAIANEGLSLFANDDVDIQGMMNTNVTATDGKVTVKGQRMKLETTGGDIEIEAMNDVKVTGMKIYLN